MFRTITAIMALAVLLATAACTDITGPAATSDPASVGGSGPSRDPQVRDATVINDPEPPGGGGVDPIGDLHTKRLGGPGNDRSLDDPVGGGSDPTRALDLAGSHGGRRSRGDVGRGNP